MEMYDLSSHSYFELEPDSRIELFVNGQSRQIARYKRTCRLFVIAIPDELESDDLPF